MASTPTCMPLTANTCMQPLSRNFAIVSGLASVLSPSTAETITCRASSFGGAPFLSRPAASSRSRRENARRRLRQSPSPTRQASSSRTPAITPCRYPHRSRSKMPGPHGARSGYVSPSIRYRSPTARGHSPPREETAYSHREPSGRNSTDFPETALTEPSMATVLPASTGTFPYSRSYASRCMAAHTARAMASRLMEGARNRQGNSAQQRQRPQNQGETSTAAHAHSMARAGASRGAAAMVRSSHGRRRWRSCSIRGKTYCMASAPSRSRGRTEGSGRTTLAGRGALRWSTLGASASLVS